ncbi:MAG: SDR family NAD(P)-dependent oxidoreductase [Burkholderiaceae bacterium]
MSATPASCRAIIGRRSEHEYKRAEDHSDHRCRQRFGRGAALALAAQGHRVIAGAQTGEQAEALRAQGLSQARKLDICDAADVRSLDGLEIDVLLNNAGRGQLGALAEVPLDLVREVFEVNVFGTLRVTQAVLAGMRARRRGRVIIVSSIAGIFSGMLSGPYAMTKHALEAMAKSLRAEMQAYGIEVCKLNPGPYATGFNDAMVEGVEAMVAAGSPEAEMARGTRQRMLGKQLDPAEIVQTMVALCTAAEVPFETFKPDDILERYGVTPVR